MPIYYKLDKTIVINSEYETPPDRGYIIEKIGTNGTAEVQLLVDGAPVVVLDSTLSPLSKGPGNLFGAQELGEHYIVIPPNTKFKAYSSGSGKVRLMGKIFHLLPGESIPADLKARYNEQTKKYITYISGSYTFTAGASWSDGQEVTLVELTPKTIEKYRFDDKIGVSVSGTASSLVAGQVSIRIYIDGKPLDMLTTDSGPYGLDAYYMPLPPSTSGVMEPYYLKEIPIEVLGDHTIKITAINVSGSDLAAASTTTSITVTLKAIAKYERTS